MALPKRSKPSHISMPRFGFIRDRFVGMHETYIKSFLDSLRKASVPE